MPCNLNFNQCCGGYNYPLPIFNCRQKIISAINNQSSSIVVINPTN